MSRRNKENLRTFDESTIFAAKIWLTVVAGLTAAGLIGGAAYSEKIIDDQENKSALITEQLNSQTQGTVSAEHRLNVSLSNVGEACSVIVLQYIDRGEFRDTPRDVAIRDIEESSGGACNSDLVGEVAVGDILDASGEVQRSSAREEELAHRGAALRSKLEDTTPIRTSNIFGGAVIGYLVGAVVGAGPALGQSAADSSARMRRAREASIDL